MPKAVPQCPVTTVKHSSGETMALWTSGGMIHVLVVSVADGAGHIHEAVLGQDHALRPHDGEDGMPYTSAAAAPRHSGSTWAASTCGAERDLCPPALLWPWVLSSPAFYSRWELPDVPGDTSCIFSYCCWTLDGINCFPVKKLQQEVSGGLTPCKKSGFTNLLPFTTAVMHLCDNGKEIYSCFSLTLNTISSYKSKWRLSLLAIHSPASPDPASAVDFCSPIDVVRQDFP